MGVRIRGRRIVLAANRVDYIRNRLPPEAEVPPVARFERNSLGFRGSEPPKDLDKYLSLITVGGSTTQCLVLQERSTWPFLLGRNLNAKFDPIWVNNAGLDGHSTFGHLILLQDHLLKLRPKVIVFLVGINDVARGSATDWDVENIRMEIRWKSPGVFLKSASAYSEFASLLVSLFRYNYAYRAGLLHGNLVPREFQWNEG